MSFRLGRLLTAVFGGITLILAAPFIGQIRSTLRSTFPGHFVRIVDACLALAVAGALIAAILRIRERRPMRYGIVGAALLLAGAYVAISSTGNPEVDSVERVHFIEYGVMTLLFYRVWSYRKDASVMILPALASFVVGTMEEWFQWFVPVRVGEFRDVLLNSVAIASGLLLSVGLDPPEAFDWHLRFSSRRLVGVFAAGTLLLFAAFIHVVHIGCEIDEPGIGLFRSHYTGSELLTLQEDRAVRWRKDPPTAFRRFSREDQYMDEALWHVQHRNVAWSAGRFADAASENRILERFYGLVLDTPSYVSQTGHRWPAEQRADAEQRASAESGVVRSGAKSLSGRYVSRAHPYPILTWSKAPFWLVVAAVVLAILAACCRPAFTGVRRLPA